ncbi:MAG: peptidase domain-containing ABC transporter [Bacteroidetes bacterium]|nr:peptidase domain-containing ABC transporter [Bacteroidota bacterium]
MQFPHYKQLDAMDCGATCLRMIAKYYGKSYSLQTLRERSYITREGVSMLGISDAAESIGMRTMGVKVDFDKLIEEKPFPLIAHWRQVHFVVVYDIKKRSSLRGLSPKQSHTNSNDDYIVYVADPAEGLVTYTKQEFIKYWASTKKDGVDKGIALLLEPQPDFYEQKDEKTDKTKFKFLFKYLKPHKKFITQLVIGLLFGSVLQLIFPFLTQSVVDYGIANNNLSFIYLVFIAQMVLFISRMSVDFIRSWIMLHISTRINISLISDFLIKLMKLPIGFFDTKMTGDLMQRIGDHQRIESFLTGQTLNVLFSFFNLIIFGAVLAYYSLTIFAVFLVGSALYIAWILIFMKRRRELDFKRFQEASNNQSNIIQLIQGMQEIKLQNAEKQKRWEWERIQAKLFKVSIKGLSLSQYQQSGTVFINETKNILISIIAATSVINGNMTLGMMLAVQYIIGQLNSPIEQMITFIQSLQDAKISLERLGEIHNKKDEESFEDPKLAILPDKKSIRIKNLEFQYEEPHSAKVLKNINLEIPENKVTAIVGVSGSGKTTLVKLLLGFYDLTKGEILIGDNHLENFSQSWWRSRCGVVMQDGFIFSDSIAKNIAVGVENIDREKLLNAVKVANIQEFIESLPLGYNTKIGSEGHGLSQGQKQRILIARTVYRDPHYLFFDEATNALDANNEREIMDNLDNFFKGKTVVVVAHRLSTVKNADQIVVINKGEIVETGTHKGLTDKRGAYYELVKNQLELGN